MSLMQDCPSPSAVETCRYAGREEAARVLDVSVRTLTRLANNDQTFPPARYIGRHPKWRLALLLEWMEQRPGRP